MNNKHRVFFSLILLPLLLAMTSIFGQQNKPLTLGEAVELSIKNSKQLQLSKAKLPKLLLWQNRQPRPGCLMRA